MFSLISSLDPSFVHFSIFIQCSHRKGSLLHQSSFLLLVKPFVHFSFFLVYGVIVCCNLHFLTVFGLKSFLRGPSNKEIS